jgi:pectate lyase
MKVTLLAAVLALAQVTISAPTPTVDIEKRSNIVARAAITDVATLGYATQNGGTSGGKGGPTTTVSTLAQFTAAVAGDSAAIVVVAGTISGAAKVRVGSNKTILGKNSSAKLVGVGLYINKVKNVIVRNLTIQKVLAENGDAIGIQASSNVWVDHVDLSSDLDHDKDYYDGLLDITHASDYVTVTYSFLHDHWKANLIGHSDDNGAEDKGHLIVTEAYNYFKNVNRSVPASLSILFFTRILTYISRGPSFRFGTGHIFNNYYESVNDGINTRDGAQLLVESNQFVNSKKPLYSTDAGYAVSNDNDFGGGANTALAGTLKSVPYTYTKVGSGKVKAAVVGSAGATLSF